MTADPKQRPLVYRVACVLATRRAQAKLPRQILKVDYAAPTDDDFQDAKAALDACHVEVMIEALNRLTQATGTLLNVDLSHVKEVQRAIKDLMAELWWRASQAGFDWKDMERRKISSVGRAYDQANALLSKLDSKP